MRFEDFIGVDFWTALFVLLNTLAIFFVARKLLFKPVHKLISDRQNEIDGMYSEADRLKEEALALRNEYAQKLESAQNEADEMIKAAAVRAEEKGENILRQARSDAGALMDRAAEQARLEKQRALTEAKDEIASIAVSIAEKVVEKHFDPADQSALVDEFIDRLDKTHD